MKLCTSIICLFLFFLFSCTTKNKSNSTILSTDSLAAQVFELSLDKDTTLKTSGGALLTIPKGTFQSSTRKTILLEIKEAYTPESIVRAGLTTQSDNGPLSSGGMIYLGSKDSSQYRFVGKVSISLPTPVVNPAMKLFKGETDADGSRHWAEEKPLQNPKDLVYAKGEELFNNNCTSCHTLGNKKIGPDLAYISERRKKEWLYTFTTNSIQLIKGYDGEKRGTPDPYAACLYKEYNYTEMTSFSYTEEELDALYNFITNYSYQNKLPYPKDELFHCTDSCTVYTNKLESLTKKRKKLVNKNGKNSWKNKTGTNTNILPDTADTPVAPATVQPVIYQPEYYQIEINTFGWYNIDIFLKELPEVKECNLQVSIDGNKNDFQVYLIVPDYNALLDGGLMEDNQTYSFYKSDGSVPLPVGRKAYILSMKEDKEGVWFKIHEFILQQKEKILIRPVMIKTQEVTAEIKKLNLKDFNLQIKETVHNKEIRETDKELKNIEILRPKNCDCNCADTKTADGSLLKDSSYSLVVPDEIGY